MPGQTHVSGGVELAVGPKNIGFVVPSTEAPADGTVCNTPVASDTHDAGIVLPASQCFAKITRSGASAPLAPSSC